MTTIEQIREWFNRGVKEKADFMIVACDTYDWGDYPIYGSTDDFAKAYREATTNMQKVMEVYDLQLDRESQLKEFRARHYPKGWQG